MIGRSAPTLARRARRSPAHVGTREPFADQNRPDCHRPGKSGSNRAFGRHCTLDLAPGRACSCCWGKNTTMTTIIRLRARAVAAVRRALLAASLLSVIAPGYAFDDEWQHDWTVLTLAGNGAWGVATHNCIHLAIASAIRDCKGNVGWTKWSCPPKTLRKDPPQSSKGGHERASVNRMVWGSFDSRMHDLLE
jgi:hypothetical protein